MDPLEEPSVPKQCSSTSDEQVMKPKILCGTKSKNVSLATLEMKSLEQKVCDGNKDDLDGLLKTKGYRFIKQLSLTEDNFSKATSGKELIMYGQLEADNILTQNLIIIIILISNWDIVIGRVYEKSNPSISLQGSDDENEVSNDYHQHSNSNQKRNRKVHESKSKKRKTFVLNQKVNYSDNLKEITSKFNINGQNATKVQNNDKVALYFSLPKSFLKIVHYFDNSSENSKGMNIVKELEHDNINKILHFERMNLSSSQLNELFFENIETNAKTCVFITMVQLVSDLDLFYFYLKEQNMNHRLLRYIKIMLDGIEAVNTLHKNSLIHGDISIRNVGILFTDSSKTAFLEEKLEIVKLLEKITDVADFNFILLDQGQITFKECNQDIADNVFYPFTSDPYCPTTPSIQFTKEHDYYSMAMVLAQLLLSLGYDVTFEELEKWEKANLKEIILEELEKRKGVYKNADIMIKLLKDTIENEGNSDLFNFEKTFELLNDHLVHSIRENLEKEEKNRLCE